MAVFKFGRISRLQTGAEIDRACWLVIWNPDKKPPHVGISSENAYFSLKYTGKDRGIPTDRLLSFAFRKAKKILLAEVNISLTRETLVSVFEPFSYTIPGRISCMKPVIGALGKPQADTLPELLNILEKEQLLGRVFQLNLDQFDGVLEYSSEDINKRLDELDAKRRNHFSAGA